MNAATTHESALNRARTKAYWRLLPLLFICYVIAYVDRANVSLAKLTMSKQLVGFDEAVFGFGSGIFFLGYFLLEIPGSLIVERWSARKWICRIMITWGIMAALTSLVKTPHQFYTIRFLLGLAEAGFFPGVVIYLTHWFPARDRTKALAWFMIATPMAQILSPKISNVMLRIGSDETVNGTLIHHPQLLGLNGWQWVYIFWGIPAVVLGVIVFFTLTDRPRQAEWLTKEEREALESELELERARRAPARRLTVFEALSHPKVLWLAAAYFCSVTASYGFEFFAPTILKDWYGLTLNKITWLVILPPLLALAGQVFVGWNSDRAQERRIHVVVPLLFGMVAFFLVMPTKGNVNLTVACFMVAYFGAKAYLPAFWALPSLLLTEAAAAGSIGLINSVGNLGGYLGPSVMGYVKEKTGSFSGGLYFSGATLALAAIIIFFLGLGRKEPKPEVSSAASKDRAV